MNSSQIIVAILMLIIIFTGFFKMSPAQKVDFLKIGGKLVLIVSFLFVSFSIAIGLRSGLIQPSLSQNTLTEVSKSLTAKGLSIEEMNKNSKIPLKDKQTIGLILFLISGFAWYKFFNNVSDDNSQAEEFKKVDLIRIVKEPFFLLASALTFIAGMIDQIIYILGL